MATYEIKTITSETYKITGISEMTNDAVGFYFWRGSTLACVVPVSQLLYARIADQGNTE